MAQIRIPSGPSLLQGDGSVQALNTQHLYTITGKVIVKDTGIPLSGATVYLQHAGQRQRPAAKSNANGVFLLDNLHNPSVPGTLVISYPCLQLMVPDINLNITHVFGPYVVAAGDYLIVLDIARKNYNPLELLLN